MERHKCRLCTRTFNNGRALGGHMKAHLTPLPRHPPTHSASSSSPQQQHRFTTITTGEDEDKSLIYALRENPRKSFRVADPEFSFAVDSAASVVQDRESETDSRNLTRRRSKRNRGCNNANSEINKHKLMKPSGDDSSSPEPASSISETSPDEEVARCLMMLSRDHAWKKKEPEEEEAMEESEEKFKSRKQHRCDKCNKAFKSYHALGGHRRICLSPQKFVSNVSKRTFRCPFCFKLLPSGQALGGHKRWHLLASSDQLSKKNNFIDLNMPAPMEEDQFSVVSDA